MAEHIQYSGIMTQLRPQSPVFLMQSRERKYDSSITDSERLAGIEYQLTLLRIDQQEARARRTP